MAQFTAQGRLKLFFKSDEFQSKLGGSGCVNGLGSFEVHKRKICFLGSSSTRLHAASLSKKSRHFITNASGAPVSEEGVNDDSDSEEVDELSCFRGLVLDVSYRPVNVVCWRRAICLEFMDKLMQLFLKADVLEYYDQTVNSPSGSFYIPAVLRVPHLLQVVKRRRVQKNLSRKNILYRDKFICQYCSSHENLTVDHVVPVVRGGDWSWENLVAACAKCNSKKGQKTVEQANMKLLKAPKAPKEFDILAIPLTGAALRMLTVRKGTPEEWRQYLSQPFSEP